MPVLGSVFLGDAHHHHRVFTTTPPTSPPPPSKSSSSILRAHQARVDSVSSMDQPKLEELEAPVTARISPEVSLELRLRWLEALILGVRQDATREARKPATEGRAEDAQKQETLFRRAEEIQRRLDAIVASNDGLKRFMEHYGAHAQYLTPAFALSGIVNTPSEPPAYSSLSSTELDAFLSEMEGDIRAADRDLREIDALEKRGVTAPGKLVDHEALQPRLQALVKAHEEDLAKAAALEKRIGALLEQHATKVDALSELFVAWNDVITEAEDRVSKAERQRVEQRRLGFE